MSTRRVRLGRPVRQCRIQSNTSIKDEVDDSRVTPVPTNNSNPTHPTRTRKRRAETPSTPIKRPKYVGQPNEYTCGPTALYNLVLWAQPEASPVIPYRQLEQLCRTHLPIGTAVRDFETALTRVQRGLNLEVMCVQEPSYQQIEHHLATGGVVILEYHWDDRPPSSPISRETYGQGYGDHFVLVTEVKDNRFIIINNTFSDVISSVSRREFKRLLWPFQYEPALWPDSLDNRYPIAWLISRPSCH
jgi:hypothetical protein